MTKTKHIMKLLTVILIVFLFALEPACAQDIYGKWKCSKEYLSGLGLGKAYKIKGTCRFKKKWRV